MISRSVVIGVVILLLVSLGFLFMTTMTGNVITGSVSNIDIIENEQFKISDFGEGLEVENESSDIDSKIEVING